MDLFIAVVFIILGILAMSYSYFRRREDFLSDLSKRTADEIERRQKDNQEKIE